MKRFASFMVAAALVASGCQDHEVTNIDQGESSGGDESGGHVDPNNQDGELNEPYEVKPAPWTAELHSVVMDVTEDGAVLIDALDHDGLLVARVVLERVGDSLSNDVDADDLTVFSVRSKFADMSSWAIVDMANATVVSLGSKPQGDLVQAEIAMRINAILEMASEQDAVKGIKKPQKGPWLDCALSVLGAVFACLPTNPGWVITCPKAIVEAVCACHTATQSKKKNKNKKPAPAGCENVG